MEIDFTSGITPITILKFTTSEDVIWDLRILSLVSCTSPLFLAEN